jgi:DNA-binding IclR family transcriptional regulator
MTPPPPPVTAEQAPIIRCLACWTDGGDRELAEDLNMPIATVKYHLDNLKSAGYATSSSYTPAYGNMWHLTTSGNAFAAQNNLGSGAPVRRRPTGPYRA